MKTKIFLMTGLLVFAGIVSGQNENRQSKSAATAAKVKKTVESGRYQLDVDQAQPMNGRFIALTSKYTLNLQKDSSTAFLPYFGRAYRAPFNSDGGIKFSEPVKELKMLFNDKKQEFNVSFTVQTTEDTYRFFISIWTNGTARINVTGNNRQPIYFTGEIELPEI